MDGNGKGFERWLKPDVPHSIQTMTYSKYFTCNAGELIPCYEQEVYPGERIALKNAFSIKSLPLTSPLMADISVYTHYWFCSYEMLQNHETIEAGLDTNTFADYICGKTGKTIPMCIDVDSEGNETNNLTASVTSEVTTGNFAYVQVPALSSMGNYSLLDYFNIGNYDKKPYNVPQFLIRAYNAIYNTKYRNENIQTSEYDRVIGGSSFGDNDGICIGLPLTQTNILRRNWTDDYFTSMLPWQQKGTPIALPVTSSVSSFLPVVGKLTSAPNSVFGSVTSNVNETVANNGLTSSDGAKLRLKNTTGASVITGLNSFEYGVEGSKINITSTAFDINDLRLANSVQRFLEANARGGTRYHEFCLAHFGVSENDSYSRFPVFLGSSKSPLVISEVTQTSSSTLTDSTPQGTLTGKAESADSEMIFVNRFRSHGVVIGLFSIMPKPVYGTGIDRMWIKTDVFDFYSPEFANLGEQPIYDEELNDGRTNANALRVIGFNSRWQEMRTRKDVAVAGFHDSRDPSSGFYGGMGSWIVQRKGTSGNEMRLNSSMLVCKPDFNCFAYPNSKNFIVDYCNIVKMSRIVPDHAEPKLVG